jgi:subtilase family serine protease
MNFSLSRVGVPIAALYLIAISAGYAASPQPADLGSFVDRAGDRAISVSLALKLRDAAGAEAMMRRIATPGDPLYQQFMTPEQVKAQFGPREDAVAAVVNWLRGRGLTVERTTATTLKATAPATTLEQIFQTSLHQFQLPATDKRPTLTFHAPTKQPVVPTEIASAVWAIAGLSNKPVFRPHSRQAPASLGNVAVRWSVNPAAEVTAVNPPGYLTVADFAARYNVTPLYKQGFTGQGRTIGIVTLANFTPNDVFSYWSSLNLKVDPNRLTVINVDDGPGPPSDASDSSETTLDVEQSGGVAPGAKIIVYQAPNTTQGFLDAFAAAIQSNKVDSISVSWGMWEWFYNDLDGVTDPFSGQFVSFAQATHELFIEAALQGQSLFSAAGDSGAFDSFGVLPPPFFTFPLSVDFPAADTAITAVGGTTLPVTLYVVTQSTGASFSINIPTERVWGWDYLKPVCDAQELDPISCGIFPVGSGGGVSVFSPLPFYQFGTVGVQTSQPRQVLVEEDTTPPTTIFDLPAQFRGRNVPDVSLNADPLTGYTVYYTSDVYGFEVRTFDGGTSFVAPQLNGVTALLTQKAGHRLGLLNPLLYGLGLTGSHDGNSVLNTISAGDNWFYAGRNGYSPAAGLGTTNVTNLARTLK